MLLLVEKYILSMRTTSSRDKVSEFFKTAYKWFSERYGEDNIVTAVVHMDEITPHMHLLINHLKESLDIREQCIEEKEENIEESLDNAYQKGITKGIETGRKEQCALKTHCFLSNKFYFAVYNVKDFLKNIIWQMFNKYITS